MSEIDHYRHELLGFIDIPSDFPSAVVYGGSGVVRVAVYQFAESVPEWSAKTGDILVGGGRGECPAFRISMPEAAQFLFTDDEPHFESRAELYQAYWRPNEAYALCTGFLKLGWNPAQDVEQWLAEFVLLQVQSGSLRGPDEP